MNNLRYRVFAHSVSDELHPRADCSKLEHAIDMAVLLLQSKRVRAIEILDMDMEKWPHATKPV